MSDTKDKIYFPGLNGLRFLAALAVILSHIELLKFELGYEHSWENVFFFYIGGLGVYFFFVLSGFLITYLLLAEKVGTSTIGIKDFYIRRILRIWPLYFLLTFLGFFVFPKISFLHLPYFSDVIEEGYFFKLISYLLILPNLALSVFHPVPHVGQLWSIGVEEQFYLFWPVLMRFAKNIFRTLLVIVSAVILFKVFVLAYGLLFPVSETFFYFKKFVAMNKFECMVIGAIGAYLVHMKHRLINLSYLKMVQWLSIISIPVLLYFTSETVLQDGIHILYSISFLIIILNVSGNRQSILNLENGFFDELGKISYGIYMYHMFIVVLVINAAALIFNINSRFSFFENSMIYFSSVVLTIIVSYVSYHFFEKKFIKMKLYFSRIVSGDMVKSRHLTPSQKSES